MPQQMKSLSVKGALPLGSEAKTSFHLPNSNFTKILQF